MKKPITALIVVLVLFAACTKKETSDRPNIVWIVLEDITPMMGCYGDEYAKTPVFDRLAAEGIRYEKAYSVAPVCSPSRSGVITGMYPTSLGTIHHRSHRTGPDFLTMIPVLMREAGYYTSNNAKTDYNLPIDPWDDRSKEAHWRNRPVKDQPFLSKFDFGECHSSITKIPEDVIVEQRLNRLKPEDFHDPDLAPIPPYHPDVPEFRQAWSRYYDAVTQVDYRTGEIIEQLKEDGLWENTIVFVWADHGVGMIRGKHTVWEQGTHVPLIVRYPAKFKHLAPAKAGSVKDDLISLIDIGPTTLALAGVETPGFMDGRPLLCNSKVEKRDYVFAARGRLDSRFEMVRTVRDERYRYHRNFFPHLPYKPHEDYEFGAPVLQKWVELAKMGKLTGDMEMPTLRFKPVEELYDSEHDSHMINNLVDNPEYEEVLERMRRVLHNWMVETRDLGILEEAEMVKRSEGNKPQWHVGQELENYEEILETADLMYQGEAAIPELLVRAGDPDAAIRFWAVLSLAVCRSGDEEVVSGLEAALADESVSVRLSAAEGLFNLKHYEVALPVIIAALDDPIVHARIRAAGILDSQPPEVNEQLQSAIGPLRMAAEKTDIYRMPGIPFGLNYPFERAIKAISGEEVYYRWSDGASGTP